MSIQTLLGGLLLLQCLPLTLTVPYDHVETFPESLGHDSAHYAVEELNRLYETTDVHFSLRSLDSVDVYESRLENPVRVPVRRSVTLWDPSTDLPFTISSVGASKELIFVVDTSVDMMLTLNVEGSSLESGVEARCSVSLDGQGYQALTKFTLPALPDPLQHLWTVPQAEAMAVATPGSAEATVRSLLALAPREHAFVNIMCVNIWNYNHWFDRKSVLANAINEHNADIIGFQEVRARKVDIHNTSRFQVQDLAHMLGPGYQFAYVPAMDFAESSNEYVHEGLAVFSKFPIVHTDHLELTRDPDDSGDFHQRMCLRARVSTPIGYINFLTTHMSLSERARKRTLREIGEWTKKMDDPAILLGDFNAEFTTTNNPLVNDYNYQDAWLSLHAQAAAEDGWTFNSWFRKSRIDYILHSPGLRALSMEVVGKTGVKWPTFLQGMAGVKDMKQTMFPSDHMLLKARIVRASD